MPFLATKLAHDARDEVAAAATVAATAFALHAVPEATAIATAASMTSTIFAIATAALCSYVGR
jgi:hypothetical protein